MCFTEYLGYTCGHTSLPVKRACPLTTQLHNNPSCPRSAVRPILAPGMCPPCARILHARYVNIIEYEHRFMHERGACGCAVRFPNLQGPRVVSSSSSSSSGPPPPAGGSSSIGTGTRGKGRRGGGRRGAYSSSSASSALAARGGAAPGALAPLYEEEVAPGTDKTLQVNVRLPSLYGAEWVHDHAPLHEEGKCGCDICFNKYEAPYMAWIVAGQEEQEQEQQESEGNASSPSEGGPAAAAAAAVEAARTTAEGQGQDKGKEPENENPQHGTENVNVGGGLLPVESGSGMVAYAGDSTTSSQGWPARWACSPAEMQFMDRLNPSRVGAAEWQRQIAHPVDMQSVWYNNQSEIPVAGLPIGAGPEGDSHMPPFEECELYYPKKKSGNNQRPHSR
ncbi:hypothetical protein F4779DRAFT_622774 [Xylariaceae sp. FL0662B]|nr:hypothetical protein F4779DRAFT_622774 [Xylariaceae sp. FL0662B]